MSNVPKLRFSEFNVEWREFSLHQIGKITTGSTPSTSNSEYYGGERLFVSPADIQGNRYITDTKTTLTDMGYRKGRAVVHGAVCFVCIGSTIGKVAQLKHPAITNQQINTVEATDGFYNSFVYSLLELKAGRIKRLAGEQAVPLLNKSEFSKLKYYFPSAGEQQKIADFLTAVDTKIEQLTRKEELLKQYKKGVMQKIFSQEIRFKADEGSEFSEWEEKRLRSVTQKVSKKNKDSVPYPIYSISNKHGFIPQGEQFEGMDSNARNYDISLYKVVGEKTFAYNPARINVGSIGYSGSLKDIIISSLYVCFRASDLVDDRFLEQYFKTFDFNKSVLRNTEGGVRDYLFYENFSAIKTAFPCLPEQKKIVEFLNVIDGRINIAAQNLELAKTFKKGLLQQMFV